jgi:hypothetical protein
MTIEDEAVAQRVNIYLFDRQRHQRVIAQIICGTRILVEGFDKAYSMLCLLIFPADDELWKTFTPRKCGKVSKVPSFH